MQDMRVNDIRCTVSLLISVIKKRTILQNSNIRFNELEIAACLAVSFVKISEALRHPFALPFFSITAKDSLTDREMIIQDGALLESYIARMNEHFQEKGIDFSIGINDHSFIDFQLKRVATVTDIQTRLVGDQVVYGGESMVLIYHIECVVGESIFIPNTIKSDLVKDVIISYFSNSGHEFTWYSTKDEKCITVAPPWLGV